MKISKNYILEHVNSNSLCDDLTQAGLEVEETIPVAGNFEGVVVGHIIKIVQHPDAERLKVCAVDVGANEIQVVTNLESVFVGLRLPVALVGASLADGMEIKPTKLRGVESNGMFCSCESLGMVDSSLEIIEFPESIQSGEDVKKALDLDDEIIDIAITPNRGDCLSYRGIARQLAAYTAQDCILPARSAVEIKSKSKVEINDNVDAAPVFAVRGIEGIDPSVKTPLHIVERLRRSGIRSINLVVDCLNLVMIECGAPMHAYDQAKISGALQARYASAGEKITLLNDQEISLDETDLVIADSKSAQALAGVMGGLASGVNDSTTSVILEAAYFEPEAISKAARKHKLSSDSSYRFERGADWDLCEFALDSATQYITDIAGGAAGPINCVKHCALTRKTINLRFARVAKVLGQKIPSESILKIFASLGCEITASDNESCTVLAPSFRSDLVQECDLIEEILIISGVNNLPAADLKGSLRVNAGVKPACCSIWQRLYRLAASLGFQEAITYSFISPADHALFADSQAREIANPISPDMSVMRPSLLPGLLRGLEFNINHQQDRAQLFEFGQSFTESGYREELSGIIYGPRVAKQWSSDKTNFNIFDCKKYVTELLATIGLSDLGFKSVDAHNKSWHPGQSCDVIYNGVTVARIGRLHPRLDAEFSLKHDVYMFTIYLDDVDLARKSSFKVFSDQPAMRRDISLIVKGEIPSSSIIEKTLEVSGDLLDNIHVFDVYQGQGLEADCKSIGFTLTFRASDRTLVEAEVNAIMQQVLSALDSKFGAKLRM
jgi:phenylalanyl-tRNA synthetase beta chain